MKSFLNKKKGFTLVEMMIAIFVILLGLLATFSLLQRVIFPYSLIHSRLTAYYLAQEGIETIRNIRDTNWLKVPTVDWDEGISAETNHRFDYRSTHFPDFGCGQYLEYDDTEGFYICSDNTSAKYQREIEITKTGDYLMNVKVWVRWSERGKDYEVNIEENLYNWNQ